MFGISSVHYYELEVEPDILIGALKKELKDMVLLREAESELLFADSRFWIFRVGPYVLVEWKRNGIEKTLYKLTIRHSRFRVISGGLIMLLFLFGGVFSQDNDRHLLMAFVLMLFGVTILPRALFELEHRKAFASLFPKELEIPEDRF